MLSIYIFMEDCCKITPETIGILVRMEWLKLKVLVLSIFYGIKLLILLGVEGLRFLSKSNCHNWSNSDLVYKCGLVSWM